LEQSFASNVYCSCASTKTTELIIDRGVTYHLTPVCTNLLEMQECKEDVNVNLPDGNIARITHKGHVRLDDNLVLKIPFVYHPSGLIYFQFQSWLKIIVALLCFIQSSALHRSLQPKN